jgi:hypothetical protein
MVTVTVSIDCLPLKVVVVLGVNTAVPVALIARPVGEGKLKVTLGAVVYPEPPPLVSVTEATDCPNTAVAAAPLPPPPVNVMVGTLV